MKKSKDREYQEMRVVGVEKYKDEWMIKLEDGSVFWFEKKYGVKPKVGQSARFYGDVRGLDLDGQEVFYRTPQEQAKIKAQELREEEKQEKAEFKRNKAKLDAQYRALPKVFQRRINRFRKNNPDFRWKFEEYELIVCTQAMIIAKALKTLAAIQSWKELGFRKQKRLVPGLWSGHSGNTFDAACFLATMYLEQPEKVVKQCGAAAPLVGCKNYGCKH
jgi:hypothetical protein